MLTEGRYYKKKNGMGYLKIIFYGLLAFIERHPLLSIMLVALLVIPPIISPTVRWIMLGIFVVMLIIGGLAWWKLRSLKRKFEKEYNDMFSGSASHGGGFSGFSSQNGGFSAYGFHQGMRLEDFVKAMQEQADARQSTTPNRDDSEKQATKSDGEYVDFEEIK